jgi:hypothetical protein
LDIGWTGATRLVGEKAPGCSQEHEMNTTKNDVRPDWLTNSRPLWSEDDSGCYDREWIGAAWNRLFGESLFTDQAIARYDAGDAEYFLLPKGRIQVMAFDGGRIRVQSHVELQIAELFEFRTRPSLLESLNTRGIYTLAELKENVGEGHLDDLPTKDQVHITEILNDAKRSLPR